MLKEVKNFQKTHIVKFLNMLECFEIKIAEKYKELPLIYLLAIFKGRLVLKIK